MSERGKVSALTRRVLAVRAVVLALANQLLSDGATVDPKKVARLGLLPFEGSNEPPADPRLSPAELERFVRERVGEWTAGAAR